jgi:ubiquinone/menaquinone biosynthesis C-methylase UbiE
MTKTSPRRAENESKGGIVPSPMRGPTVNFSVEAGANPNDETGRRSLWRWLDACLGRGSYRWLAKWLDPDIEYSQYVYASELDRLVKGGVRWLDAGCGHQILEVRLRQEEEQLLKRTALAVGCDASAASLRSHRSLHNLVACTLDHLPFRDAGFDLVTLNMVAEHLDRPRRVLREIARITDKSGLVVIHTPNAAGYQTWLARLGWRVLPSQVALKVIRFLEHRDAEDVFPTFYRANRQRELRELLKGAGMEEENVRLVRERPFFFFFAPLAALEMVLERLLRWAGQEELCATTILGVYRARVTRCHRGECQQGVPGSDSQMCGGGA